MFILVAQLLYKFGSLVGIGFNDLKMSMIAGIIVSVSLTSTRCIGISKPSMKLVLKRNKFHIQSQISCELYGQTDFNNLGELIDRSGSQYA